MQSGLEKGSPGCRRDGRFVSVNIKVLLCGAEETGRYEQAGGRF